MPKKYILITVDEDGRSSYSSDGFTNIEVIGLLRIFEQQESLQALQLFEKIMAKSKKAKTKKSKP